MYTPRRLESTHWVFQGATPHGTHTTHGDRHRKKTEKEDRERKEKTKEKIRQDKMKGF